MDSRTGYIALFVLCVSDWCVCVCVCVCVCACMRACVCVPSLSVHFTTITSLSNLDALYTSNCGHGLATFLFSNTGLCKNIM